MLPLAMRLRMAASVRPSSRHASGTSTSRSAMASRTPSTAASPDLGPLFSGEPPGKVGLKGRTYIRELGFLFGWLATHRVSIRTKGNSASQLVQ